MKRILLDGCLAELMFIETLDNKLAMLKRRNLKTFKDNPDLIKKAINKKDQYSHLVLINEDICRASAYCHTTTQTVVIKPGKADQIAWDGSAVFYPMDIVMNQVTPVSREAPITFGHVKIQSYIDIYNTQISHPTATILMEMANIKACFCFPQIHPNLTGAFQFMAGGYYNLATAMLFGSTTSASSWEPFRRAIEALSVVYADRPDQVIKHKYYLDMILWEETNPTASITQAIPCLMNKGTLDAQGNRAKLPARIYVNDTLVLALSKCHTMQVLAALIEAIFVIMGKPDTTVQQCPLVMDKWLELIVAPKQRMLGLIIDTNNLTVGIPPNYIKEVLNLIITTWHLHHRGCFTIGEAQRLTGKLGHLAEGAQWVFHLLTHLYAAVAYALAKNKQLLKDSSPKFCSIYFPLKMGNSPAWPRTRSSTSIMW